MEIYVGNLSKKATKEELQEKFEKFGQVLYVKFKMDIFTKAPKGYAFVNMPNEEEASAAIKKLNGWKLHGQAIIVKEARPHERDWQKGLKSGKPF